MARRGTDEERVMETIFKPVWCILKSVKIRAIRGQNSNESRCKFGVRSGKMSYHVVEVSYHVDELRCEVCGRWCRWENDER
jgi:hypothetical protein